MTMRTQSLAFSDLMGMEDVISALPNKVDTPMRVPSHIALRLIALLPDFDSDHPIEVEFIGNRDAWLFSQATN